jgi:transcriptional regulator with XRE-family HTH domain
MQENKQFFSSHKQNILLFIKSKGISQRDFYAQTKVSRGTLTNDSSMSENTMNKIFKVFPELKSILYKEEISANNIIEEPKAIYYTTDNNSINERILKLIKLLNLNKKSFSEKIKLSSPAVLENIVGLRKSKPSFDIIEKIIQYTEINANWLITGRGEIFIKQINKMWCENCKHKEQIIEILEKRINDLLILINTKDELITNIKKQAK